MPDRFRLALEPRIRTVSAAMKSKTLSTSGARTLDDVAGDAAVGALQDLTCEKVRRFLSGEVPDEFNPLIRSFSVEDFEGVEDPSVISIEKPEPNRLIIDLFFNLHTVIWTVQVALSDFREHQSYVPNYFINIEVGNELVSLDLVQRVYFRATLIF